MNQRLFFIYILPLLSLVALAGFGYAIYVLTNEGRDLRETISERETTIGEQEDEITRLSEALEQTRNDRDQLAEALEEAENQNEEFAEQIEDLTGTVNTLDKLARTDEELLQKYSKVYFLNEHFVPPDLDEIEDEYVYDEDKEHLLDERVMPYLEDMIEDAQDDDIDLWVVSAYRSFDEQTQLKSSYRVTYGSGANAFSADQGYSEHQLGTTVDFTTSGIGGGLSGFGNTEAYEWLQENAHKYGFVLSYPENNQYYVFEPWHWRFVGEELAEDLHDDGRNFYDVPQRELDEYLISIFD